jgi:type III pantothenate kinase
LLLAVDIGNTNVSLGVFDGERLAHHWRIATHLHYTSDEYAVAVRAMFGLASVATETVREAIVTCVVPPLAPIWERTCTKLFGCEPLFVGPGVRTGMPMRVDNPREVGADRLVNAIAAYDLLGGPAIAIDFGTATSFDCVNAAGEFVGGVIFPGILVSLEALVGRAARLSSVEIERPPHAIGRNTTHCLQSGMLFGYAGLVDSVVARVREELGAEAAVVATGGLAHVIASETKTIQRVEPFLTMQGLRLIFERNRESGGPARRARGAREERGA